MAVLDDLHDNLPEVSATFRQRHELPERQSGRLECRSDRQSSQLCIIENERMIFSEIAILIYTEKVLKGVKTIV